VKKGVKVKIHAEGPGSEGYIVRRLSADNYEIWSESQDKILFLCPKEFTELPEKEHQ